MPSTVRLDFMVRIGVGGAAGTVVGTDGEREG
jgi:hypothetical protein